MSPQARPTTRKTFTTGAVLAAAAGVLVATALPASAATKVTLCHATGSSTNPYVEITVAAAGAYHGHYLEHQTHPGSGDIIPSFTYQGHSYSLNLTTANKKILKNHCQVPSGGGGGGGGGGGYS